MFRIGKDNQNVTCKNFWPFIYLFTYLSIYLFVYLFIYLFIGTRNNFNSTRSGRVILVLAGVNVHVSHTTAIRKGELLYQLDLTQGQLHEYWPLDMLASFVQCTLALVQAYL